jgi:hypothetical protein
MRRVFGPRTVVEAAFLVAVPVAAAAFSAGMWTIIAASAVAYLLIFVFEATLWREGAPLAKHPRMPSRTVKQPQPSEPAASDTVTVTSGAALTPEAASVPTQEPEPAPEPAPEPTQQPSFAAPGSSEHLRVLRPEPEPEPEPAPEPVAERAQLAAVPEPEPEPEPAAPEPAAPSTVVPIGVGTGPRQWNLWELERLTREHGGGDVAQAEERQFLLMYLREFADSDGQLPVDFDGLVRDSFGELVESR